MQWDMAPRVSNLQTQSDQTSCRAPGMDSTGCLCSTDGLRISAPAAGARELYQQLSCALGNGKKSGFVLPTQISPRLLAFIRE